jgi:hypothetical protein
MQNAPLDPRKAIEQAASALTYELGPAVPTATVWATVETTFARLDAAARYKEFVPLLTKRYARETLLGEPGNGQRPE